MTKYAMLRWIRAAALAAMLSSVALSSLAQSSTAGVASRRASEEAATALAFDRELIVGPTELFLVSADVFARSYFLDLLPHTSWGPDEALWKANYPSFLEIIIASALPRGTTIEAFLASELTTWMSVEQLLELRSSASDPRMREAIELFRGMGLNPRFVLLAEHDPRVVRLYSREEMADATRTLDIMRGRLPELEQAKAERELLRNFLESAAFKRCQAVVGGAFMQTVGRLEADKARFRPILRVWKAYLSDQNAKSGS